MVASVIAIVVVMLAVWLLSIVLEDVSIIDLVWGPAFAVTGWAARIFSDGGGAAGTLALLCVTVWGLRLGVHLARRNIGHGEDKRYAKMREKHPDTFWIRSLPTIFLVQGALVILVGLPVDLAASRGAGAIGVLAIVGLLVWAVGFYFETVGDWQLEQFKKDPDSGDQVMDRGLWRYSRHPNYFGDVCGWWGVWLICLDANAPIWTVVGPIAMTFFIIRVSGVALTEKSIGSRRPGYEQYVQRTSAFVPLPPRG